MYATFRLCGRNQVGFLFIDKFLFYLMELELRSSRPPKTIWTIGKIVPSRRGRGFRLWPCVSGCSNTFPEPGLPYPIPGDLGRAAVTRSAGWMAAGTWVPCWSHHSRVHKSSAAAGSNDCRMPERWASRHQCLLVPTNQWVPPRSFRLTGKISRDPPSTMINNITVIKPPQPICHSSLVKSLLMSIQQLPVEPENLGWCQSRAGHNNDHWVGSMSLHR